jgi:hypothetical protein
MLQVPLRQQYFIGLPVLIYVTSFYHIINMRLTPHFILFQWMIVVFDMVNTSGTVAAAWSVVPPKSKQQKQPQRDTMIATTTCTSANDDKATVSRRSFLPIIAATSTAATVGSLLGGSISPPVSKSQQQQRIHNNWMSAFAMDDMSTTSATAATKLTKLDISDTELIQIITDDIVQRQFLVTGDITKSIYLPSATFTDEIDTYTMDQWMKGTQKLFVARQSHVQLVGNDDSSTSSTNRDDSSSLRKNAIRIRPEDNAIEFRFDEELMFNIPLLYPIVSLTGKVVLTRDQNTGYIASYREYWDQDVSTVLKSAKLFNSKYKST